MKPLNREQFKDYLRARGSCCKAYLWVTANNLSEKEAWRRCKVGGWMMWLARRRCEYRPELEKALLEATERYGKKEMDLYVDLSVSHFDMNKLRADVAREFFGTTPFWLDKEFAHVR